MGWENRKPEVRRKGWIEVGKVLEWRKGDSLGESEEEREEKSQIKMARVG